MCRPTTCKQCRNTTWAGCGSHVDQVMRNVPKQSRCTCDRNSGGRQRQDNSPTRSWFRR
jgi:hypothetical protein